MNKIFFGIFVGIAVSLLGVFIFSKLGSKSIEQKINNTYSYIKDIYQPADLKEKIEAFQKKSEITDEKINTINTRFNDMYVLGGVIITLLLGINISVYIRAENEVNKHFKENYNKHKEQIVSYVSEAEKLVGELKSKVDLAKSFEQMNENSKVDIPKNK